MAQPETRQYTNAILEAADEGILSWEALARECLAYMSEADVYDMNSVAEFVPDRGGAEGA